MRFPCSFCCSTGTACGVAAVAATWPAPPCMAIVRRVTGSDVWAPTCLGQTTRWLTGSVVCGICISEGCTGNATCWLPACTCHCGGEVVGKLTVADRPGTGCGPGVAVRLPSACSEGGGMLYWHWCDLAGVLGLDLLVYTLLEFLPPGCR